MLYWICGQSALPPNGKQITESFLRPEVSEEVLDAPSFSTLKQYFTTDAWMAVLQKGTYMRNIFYLKSHKSMYRFITKVYMLITLQ